MCISLPMKGEMVTSLIAMSRKLKNFIRGAGSVANVWPTPAENHIGEGLLERTDAEALRSDWEAIGRDLWSSINQLVPVDVQEQAESADAESPRHPGRQSARRLSGPGSSDACVRAG